jgi:hypothetical protein
MIFSIFVTKGEHFFKAFSESKILSQSFLDFFCRVRNSQVCQKRATAACNKAARWAVQIQNNNM